MIVFKNYYLSSSGKIIFKSVDELGVVVPVGTIVSMLPSMFLDNARFINNEIYEILDDDNELNELSETNLKKLRSDSSKLLLDKNVETILISRNSGDIRGDISDKNLFAKKTDIPFFEIYYTGFNMYDPLRLIVSALRRQ